MQFPRPAIVDQLAAQNLLDNALEVMASRLAIDITHGKIEYAEKFVQEYVRQASADPRVAASSDLRKAVYILIFEYSVLLNPSMEIVWDIIVLYGPLNSRKASEFLAHLPAIYKPKLAKFLLHLAENGEPVPELQKVLALFFSSGFSEIITQDWLQTLKSLKTDYAFRIANSAKSCMTSASSRTLIELFPDLTPSRANELLKDSTLEQVTQKLFDDPSLAAGKPKTKPRYVPLDKAAKSKVDVKQRTLQMALEYLDEDPDDMMDLGGQAEALSAADRRLLDQDKQLYAVLTRTPQVFEKSARKSREREQLKKRFDWSDEQLEGWAVMMKRDPRREAKLAWNADYGHKDEDSTESDRTPTPGPSTKPNKPAVKKPRPKARYKEHRKDKPFKE